MDNAEEVMHSLEEFAKFKPKDIPKELDEYLNFVAKTGDPVFKWSIIKCLFREKLINVITDFYESTLGIDLPPCPNVDHFNYERMKASLLERIDSFHGAPFTVQRISELLTNPRKEYNRADKFMRAIEKNILVVSTCEPGRHENNEEGEASFNGIPYRRDPLYDSICNDLTESSKEEKTEKQDEKTEEKHENGEKESETVICETPKEETDFINGTTPKEDTVRSSPKEEHAESSFLNIDEAIQEFTTSHKEEKTNENSEEKPINVDLECKEIQFSPETGVRVESETNEDEKKVNTDDNKAEESESSSDSQSTPENDCSPIEWLTAYGTELGYDAKTKREPEIKTEPEVTPEVTQEPEVKQEPEQTEKSEPEVKESPPIEESQLEVDKTEVEETKVEKPEEDETRRENSVIHSTSEEPQPMELEEQETPSTTTEAMEAE